MALASWQCFAVFRRGSDLYEGDDTGVSEHIALVYSATAKAKPHLLRSRATVNQADSISNRRGCFACVTASRRRFVDGIEYLFTVLVMCRSFWCYSEQPTPQQRRRKAEVFAMEQHHHDDLTLDISTTPRSNYTQS